MLNSWQYSIAGIKRENMLEASIIPDEIACKKACDLLFIFLIKKTILAPTAESKKHNKENNKENNINHTL